MTMRGPRQTIATLLLLGPLAAGGCNAPAKRTVTPAEPALSAVPGDPEGVVVAKPVPVRTASVVDRHPLFSKPAEYYESTKSKNKFVKTAKATVVGVPAGIYGEFKQIVTGVPSTPAPPAY